MVMVMGEADLLRDVRETSRRPGMRDGRLHYRLLTRGLGITVALRGPAAAAPLPGHLLDLSAGGCALAAPTGPGLGPGSSCTVGLPVTYRGRIVVTPYPAMVVGMEPAGRTAAVLHLRFRPHSFRTQRQLLSWLGSLRVQMWRGVAWQDAAPAALEEAAPRVLSVGTLGAGTAGSGTPTSAIPALGRAGTGGVLPPMPAAHDAALAVVLGLLSAEERGALLAQVAEALELAGHGDDAALLRVVLSTQVVAPVIFPERDGPTRPGTAATRREAAALLPTSMAEPAEIGPAPHRVGESMARSAQAYRVECHDCPWCLVVQRCLLTGRALPTTPPAPEYRCTTCGGTFAQQGPLAMLGSPPILPS